MIYAFITQANLPTPTATPSPYLFPNIFNFQDVTLIDLLLTIFTIALGAGAIFLSIHANKITKNANEHEKSMRKQENKTAIIDKAFIIYNFFTSDIQELDFFAPCNRQESIKKVNEVIYLSKLLFCDSVDNKVFAEATRIYYSVLSGFFPIINDSSANAADFIAEIPKFAAVTTIIQRDKSFSIKMPSQLVIQNLEPDSPDEMIEKHHALITHALEVAMEVFEVYRLNIGE